MLYLVTGSSEGRKKYIKEIEPAIEAQHIFESDISDRGLLQNISVQSGLFGGKEKYVFHNICRNINLKDVLSFCAESDNLFIFSEETSTKKIINDFHDYQGIVHDVGSEEKSSLKGFNIFSLTDALGMRDKKKLWMLFQQSQKEVSPEEIHGVLFWQIKNMFMVCSSPQKVPSGMKPFVYNKNKQFLKNFTLSELLEMSDHFTKIFHQRDTYSNLSIELEKYILSL